MSKRKRVSWAEKAYETYKYDNPPDPGFSYHNRRLFIAGYVRGRACVIGLAWLYCILVSIMYSLAIIAYFVLK